MTRWIDIGEIDAAASRSVIFWSEMRQTIADGEFWADRIKKLRDEPAKRLELAIDNLPLPGAFKEAAKTIRAMIRTKRSEKADAGDELRRLYWLAAIHSFMVPYSAILKEPGYNVMEAAPGRRIATLPYSYPTLGYASLSLLNKTDHKWIVEAWGEPASHSTLNANHRALWDEVEAGLARRRNSR